MTGLRICLLVTLALLWTSRAPAIELKKYKAGDVAAEDIITSGPLTVVDLEATERLKKKQSEQVPFVFCYNTNAAEDIEFEFRAAIGKARTNFIETYNTSGQKPADLKQFPLPGFNQFVASYKNRTKFPLTHSLATTWARGNLDEDFQSAAIAKLRAIAKVPIRDDTLPEDMSLAETIRLTPVGCTNEFLTTHMIQQSGTNILVAEIQSLTHAKMALERGYPLDRELAKYISSFLQPNCIPDADRTGDLRAHTDEPVLVADHYKAGQTIVKRGEIISRKSASAIHQLVLIERSNKPPPGLAEQLRSHLHNQITINTPFWVFVFCIALMIATIGWFLRREFKAKAATKTPHSPDATAEEWRQRALAAEQREKQSRAMARSGLISQVAKILSNSFVGRLIHHRAKLVESQHKTAEELEQLGERLVTIQAQMQNRLLAYQQQIAELEKKLDAKDEPDRNLIRTEIETIRRKWQAESSTIQNTLN